MKHYTFDYYFAIPTVYYSSPFTAKPDNSIWQQSSFVTIDCKYHIDQVTNCFVLPWTSRNILFQAYSKGKRRFLLKSKDKDDLKVFVKCKEPYNVRHLGWNGASYVTVNMAKTMDPSLIAEQNAELNLKLMMWKQDPNLPLDKLRKVRCLLIGAGTVGCSVARNLISWGIRHVTFVDCANVSHSNPVRQNLYTTNDIGQKKAQAAVESLQKILPCVKAQGHCLDIPMPGHADLVNEDDFEILDQLVSNCDVIFLSTDSREGRWLPIALSFLHSKPVVNIALGYETCLVQYITNDSGCYFCTDPIGPRDSVSSRTIDEKCTITRPGISAIASAMAVELFVDTVRNKTEYNQIRFDLDSLTFSKHKSFRNDQCSCCSFEVLSELSQKGFRFIEEIANEPSVLEDLSGYREDMLHETGDDIMTISEVGDDEVEYTRTVQELDYYDDAVVCA